VRTIFSTSLPGTRSPPRPVPAYHSRSDHEIPTHFLVKWRSLLGMDEAQTGRMAMTRAAEILGGAEPLSARLGVPQERVERWIAGEESIPVGMFSLAVAVMLENGGQHNFTQKN